jgi:hypothetical protein
MQHSGQVVSMPAECSEAEWLDDGYQYIGEERFVRQDQFQL